MAWVARALFILITAGAVAANTFRPITLHVGDALPVQVTTGPISGVPCYLTTPLEETIQLTPEDHSPDRITYIETFISSCGANITDLSENDDGEWTIYYINEDNEKVGSTYRLTVLKAETEEASPEASESASTEALSEEDDTQWLSVINHVSRTGLTIDLSLSKKTLDASQEETFTITTPQDQTLELDENANIPGVTVRAKSNFVASMVTIGPMEASLIGYWTLCGVLNTGSPKRRCQPIHISWNSLTNTSAAWDTTTSRVQNTATNYMATVYAQVRDSGNLFSCHLVTPEGEDLVITSDSEYPGLTLMPRASWDTSTCVVSIGPIHQEFIGDWILYARFRSFSGVNEVRLPLHMFLYDEQNPYNQAYNVTTLDPVTRMVYLGVTVHLEVTGSGTVDNCEVNNAAGQSFDLLHTTDPVTFTDTGSRAACAIALGPIGESVLGEWQIIGKFSDKGIHTERRQTIRIIQEDPANLIEDEHRRVILNDPLFFNTSLGAQHTIAAGQHGWLFYSESCHLRTPSGLQYTLMDGFNLTGVEIVNTSDSYCAVKMNVESENLIGEWMLISRETQISQAVELRQPFTIHIEENVAASASQVIVAEGNDLYVRLANPTNQFDSCKLYDPKGEERTDFEIDANQVNTCGFIVRNIRNEDSGIWQIHYGTGIIYIANINVAVTATWDDAPDTLVLPQGKSVNQTLGPEMAVYCKLTDPTERVIFEGFGRCNLALDRVSNSHSGTWTMKVGVQGSMLLREYHITVQVRGSADKPTVTTHVTKERPEVTLLCSVPLEYEVRSCLFQEPSGRVIIASEGVAEDRYIFHGTGTTMTGEIATHECGLRIANPATADLGLWRCAVQTDQETYYGFLTVLCPWAMQDPAVAAAVISEPTLTAHKEDILKLEGESMTLSCSIQSPIRYCYFRARNGTVFNVSPSLSSSNFEYVGAGLDAGECGIRFSRVMTTDTGRWSCHVGLPDATRPELRANIEVEINRAIEVYQVVVEVGGRSLRVEGQVVNYQAVEYCRYIRMDGLGFTSATLPNFRYSSFEDLTRGRCAIDINEPDILDMHSWTVVAKMVGTEDEVSGVTDPTIQMPIVSRSNFYILWSIVILVGVMLICVGIMVVPRKNRQNTIARTTAWRESIRESFRRSFHRSFRRESIRKAPLPADNDSRTTPMSA